MSWGYDWYPKKRRANPESELKKLKKKGIAPQPVVLSGRKISRTFWGNAWCDNLESYSDYENRLPRGRTYVRSGAVLDLRISKGEVTALVAGSSLYSIVINILPAKSTEWKSLIAACNGKIDSLIELLQGRFSSAVMEVMTDRKSGLFPSPKEIKMQCSCPDWAEMCKHLSAVLYGIGSRLDTEPSLLFELRGVDHHDLLQVQPKKTGLQGPWKVLGDDATATIFGGEILFAASDDLVSEIGGSKKPKKKPARLKKMRPSQPKPTKKTKRGR